jgi:hypothetical protein
MRTVITSSPAGPVNMHLEAKVPGKDTTPPDLNMITESTMIVIRDSRGAPVLTNRYEGCLGRAVWRYSVTTSPGAAVTREEKYDTRDEDLCLSYHLVPRERYTLVAAVGVNRNNTSEDVPADSLLVAPPITFMPPEENAGPVPPQETAVSRLKPQPVQQFPRRPTLSAEQQWDLSSRFAGKPFHGLILKACAPKPSELFVTLRNCGKNRMWIRKWSDESDYEILVRDPQGKCVQLTDKGKKFFGGGKTIDAHHLKEGETFRATLPLGDLFDMRAPGEYTVLASLPVVGDTIDAVLTAAPVKIRIDAPKAQPQPKK